MRHWGSALAVQVFEMQSADWLMFGFIEQTFVCVLVCESAVP